VTVAEAEAEVVAALRVLRETVSAAVVAAMDGDRVGAADAKMRRVLADHYCERAVHHAHMMAATADPTMRPTHPDVAPTRARR